MEEKVGCIKNADLQKEDWDGIDVMLRAIYVAVQKWPGNANKSNVAKKRPCSGGGLFWCLGRESEG